MTRFKLILFVLLGWLAFGTAEMKAQKVELGPYGGGSFFTQGGFKDNANKSVGYSFVDGGVLGFRVREILTEHFGLEQSFTFLGNNNVQFPGALLGTRLRQFYFDGNLIGYDKESRVRPYFAGGIGVSMFSPTDEAKSQTVLGSSVDNTNKFHFNFGGGLRFKLSDHFGLDFSIRDFVHKSPDFGLSSGSDADYIHNMQLQGGLLFMFGDTKPPIVHTFNVGPDIQTGKKELCPGETTTLTVGASDSIPENKITYNWTVKGQPVGTSPEYTFTAPSEPGTYEVKTKVFYDTSGLDKRSLKAVKKNPGSPAERTTQLIVKEYKPPQVTASADRNSVQRGERVRLSSNAVGSDCSGKLSYRWSVDQGRILGNADQPSAEFDSSSLSFSETQQGRQDKKVRATVEVTDEKGGKANATQDITVAYTAPPPPAPPKAVQLSDINYGPNSSRVNNCAKRVLANELYAQMTDARFRDYDILLIGHQDEAEKYPARSKNKKTTLDRERVLNAIAFLSGRGDTCKDIELSRVKAAWIGTQQSSEFKSTFCDSSTKEKKGDVVSSADEKAKNRRVEIWLVPKGAELPPGVGAIQEVPSDEVQSKGCPK